MSPPSLPKESADKKNVSKFYPPIRLRKFPLCLIVKFTETIFNIYLDDDTIQ